MRVRRSTLVLLAAIAIWTAPALLLFFMFQPYHECSLLQTIPPGGFPNGVVPTLTQAEMEVITARCSAPKLEDFVLPAIGYLVILGLWFGLRTREAVDGLDPEGERRNG